MKLISTQNLARTTVFLGFTAIVFACGKKSSGGDSSPAPAPAPVGQVIAPNTNTTAQLPQVNLPGAGTLGAPGSSGSSGGSSGGPVATGAGSGSVDSSATVLAVSTTSQGGTKVIQPTGGATFVATQSGAGGTSGSGSSSTPPPLPATGAQTYMIGSQYKFFVPPTMHLTEYTNSTSLNNLSLLRITPGSGPNQDPSYMTNYQCGANAYDTPFVAADQEGDNFDYCSTTPPSGNPGRVTNILGGALMASNHIEVSTDPHDTTLYSHDYIDVDLFTSYYPFHKGQSRFDYFCGGAGSQITVASNVAVQYSFYGTPLVASVAACPVNMSVGNVGQLPTVSPSPVNSSWWVVSYFLDTTAYNVNCYTNPTVSTTCNSYTSNTLLEVTIITKTPFTNGPDAIRYAQSVMFPITSPLLISVHP